MTIDKLFRKVDVGYLYYIIDNQLVESYGEVWHRDEWYFDSKHWEAEENIFVVFQNPRRTILKKHCTRSAGEVVDGKVWLQLYDRRKAAELLMKYEQEKIDKLIEENKRAIAAHVKRINILKEDV